MFYWINSFVTDKCPLPLIETCNYQSIVISDHAPLVMRMHIPGANRIYCPWSFNPLLLSNEAFMNFRKSEIRDFLERNQTPGMSFSVIWESLKAYLRGQIISFSAARKKADTEHLKQLLDDILRLDINYSHSPSESTLKERQTLKMKFDLISTQQVEQPILKSRRTFYEEGIGSVLAHQIRQKSSKQFISEIADEQGLKHTDHAEINSCFQQFYSYLYTAESRQDESAMDSFLSYLSITTVDPKLVTELERDLSIQEVMMAIGGMQSGKSPGPDGFLKTFSNELAPLLLSVFLESYSSGTLPPTMREGFFSTHS